VRSSITSSVLGASPAVDFDIGAKRRTERCNIKTLRRASLLAKLLRQEDPNSRTSPLRGGLVREFDNGKRTAYNTFHFCASAHALFTVKRLENMAKGKASKPKRVSRSVSLGEPLGDKVLIKPIAADDKKSPAGIILPDTVSEGKTDRGIIMAVGKGKHSDSGKPLPMHVKVGDKVLFQWGDKVEIEDEEYYIVGESNILMKLT